MEEAKKMKCYKRLIYKQFFQVSGLCGLQFLIELSMETAYWCTELVPSMAAGNQQKQLEFTFSTKYRCFRSRTSIRTHKHTF